MGWVVRSPSATSVAELRDLAERIRHGDAAAETELVREFTRRIFVMGLVRTHDQEAARGKGCDGVFERKIGRTHQTHIDDRYVLSHQPS